MPRREDMTVDECVRIICSTATGPRRAREAGLAEDTEQQRAHEIAHSNACVFVLMAMGYEGDEIRKLLEA